MSAGNKAKISSMAKFLFMAALALLSFPVQAQDLTVLTISSPEKARAGEPFPLQITVRDSRGLTDTSHSGPVTMTARMRGLAAEGTLAVTSALLDKGRAVIAEQSFTKAGVIRISVADYNGVTGESGNIEILPNEAASLTLAEEKYGGKPYAVALVRDIYSNPVKGLRVDFSAIGKFLTDPKWAFTDTQGRASSALYGTGPAQVTAAAGPLSASARVASSPVPDQKPAQQFGETSTPSEEPSVTEISPAQAERENAKPKEPPAVAPVTDFVHPDLVPVKQSTTAAQTEQRQEAAPAPKDTPAASGVRVRKFTLASGLKDKNPEGENPALSGTSVLVFWNHAESTTVPFTLVHRWFLEGKMVAEIKAVLSVSPARTWSKKTVRPGNWQVQALDESGTVLAQTSFTVEP